jgi:hypothetical protein
MDNKNFDIRLKKEYGAYALFTTRNGYQWSGMPIDNAFQMEKIAKVLLEEVSRIRQAEKK